MGDIHEILDRDWVGKEIVCSTEYTSAVVAGRQIYLATLDIGVPMESSP